jgi:hypothetical protein
LQKEIDAPVEKLKATKDPFVRRDLLRRLRRLIDEADRAIELSNKPKPD